MRDNWALSYGLAALVGSTRRPETWLACDTWEALQGRVGPAGGRPWLAFQLCSSEGQQTCWLECRNRLLDVWLGVSEEVV